MDVFDKDDSTESKAPVSLQTIAAREEALLAPYAMHSVDSKGRKHPEPEHPYRGPFQRDRDRIVHSSAYRRLSGKMQVFTGEMGDYHRTRLTHTHEVASIARTLARALRLNEDLAEALALLHDIGHPPYGHAGEDALNECLADDGGFSHNRHALTIVDELELRYHAFQGLNLTHEVLDSQASRVDKSSQAPWPLLEAQVVDAADSTTYATHDTDDAVKLGLVTLDELAENQLVRDCIGRVRQRFAALDTAMMRKAVVHELIDCQVNDLLNQAGVRLLEFGFESVQEARESDFVVRLSADVSEQKSELNVFLYERVYRHPDLVQVRGNAQRRLQQMFEGFLKRPELLPEKLPHRMNQVGEKRAIVEYLAGMTDRYCDEQFELHFT